MMSNYPPSLIAYCEIADAIRSDIHAVAVERSEVEARIEQRQLDYLHKTETARHKTIELQERARALNKRQDALFGEWWNLQVDYPIQAYDEREYVSNKEPLPLERLENYEQMEREIVAGGYRDEDGNWWQVTRELLYPPARTRGRRGEGDH